MTAACSARATDVVEDDAGSLGEMTSTGDGGDADGGDADGTSANDGEATSGTTTQGTGSSGGPELVCALASTEQECEDGVTSAEQGCVWFPHYEVTTRDGTECAFEPDGGSCVSPTEGGTGCFPAQLSACGFHIGAFGTADEFSIARSPDPCVAAPALPVALCGDLGEGGSEGGPEGGSGGEPSLFELACSCGCSEDYPR